MTTTQPKLVRIFQRLPNSICHHVTAASNFRQFDLWISCRRPSATVSTPARLKTIGIRRLSLVTVPDACALAHHNLRLAPMFASARVTFSLRRGTSCLEVASIRRPPASSTA